MRVIVGGTDAALAPLPGGGWIAGARVLAADGTARFDGWSWAQRYGRFGSPKASAISPDGRIAIIDGADSPSTCLCDRDRGTAGSAAGALVRPFDINIRSKRSYYLVVSEAKADNKTVVAFSEWLKEEVMKNEAVPVIA